MRLLFGREYRRVHGTPLAQILDPEQVRAIDTAEPAPSLDTVIADLQAAEAETARLTALRDRLAQEADAAEEAARAAALDALASRLRTAYYSGNHFLAPWSSLTHVQGDPWRRAARAATRATS